MCAGIGAVTDVYILVSVFFVAGSTSFTGEADDGLPSDF